MSSIPSFTNASASERMQVLKQLSHLTGIRLPETIVPEGESLLPIGKKYQRRLESEIYALPTIQEALASLRAVETEQMPKATQVGIQRVRLDKNAAGIYGLDAKGATPMGYSHTGFHQVCDFIKPASVRAGFSSTLLALPPALRTEAFNYFAGSQTEDRQSVLYSVRVPQLTRNGDMGLRRTLQAVVSTKYTFVSDVDVVGHCLATLPDGARVRYTGGTGDISMIELLWPAMKREIRVGDIALAGVQVTNSQTKASSIRVVPKILRVLCYNFTTAWGSGVEVEIGGIRHIGEARAKFADALQRAIATVEPFVKAFGDAYAKPLPAFAPTRGEAVQRLLKKFELSKDAGKGIVAVWDADGEKSAGDTLAGLANAVTRYSQTLAIEDSEAYEAAAGKVVGIGWEALED